VWIPCIKETIIIIIIIIIITRRSRILPEKLKGLQLVQKFSAFYGTQKFIFAFKIAPKQSLSSAR